MMRIQQILIALALAACVAKAAAQDIEYTTLDRMYVKPDVPVQAVAGSGQVRVLAYHAFPTSLRHFKLVVQSEDFDVTLDPAETAEFKPTTLESFALKLKAKRKPAGDRVQIKIGMTADELRCDKQFTITVPLTAKAAREVNDALSLPVGEIEVNVRRFGEEIYYLYVIPIFALLGWLVWRKVSAGRKGSDQ